MALVFFSYSRLDLGIVDFIAAAIEQAGFNVWMDRPDVQAGKESQASRAQIVDAIDTCDAFVLMLSPNSVVSDNVRKELDLAAASDKVLVPVLLAPTDLPASIRYELAGIQWIDLHQRGFDHSVKELLEVLRHLPPAASAGAVRQVELVIKGVNLPAFTSEKQEQLLDLISGLTDTPRSLFQILNLTPAFAYIAMPASAALQLKSQVQKGDNRLEQFGIQALRFSGDTANVPTSGGAVNIGGDVSGGIITGRKGRDFNEAGRLAGDETTDAPPPEPKPKKG